MKVYENIDFEKEEKFLREQAKMSYDHITYCDFQELDREQLKILFNKLIEKITIHEFSVPGEKEVCLNIVIDLKIPGYAPKYALQFKQDLKNREKEDKKKNTNNHKNESSYLDGGEGLTIPKSKFYFTIPITLDMVLYRSMQIEDLLAENKIWC